MTKARGFPALTFPLREDSESRASYEAALHAALAKLFPTWLCFGAPHGVSWRPLVTGTPRECLRPIARSYRERPGLQ